MDELIHYSHTYKSELNQEIMKVREVFPHILALFSW